MDGAERPLMSLADSEQLSVENVVSVVGRCIMNVEAIDVHTHLLPFSHGGLLFGIDELLTYHYLVAELFMVLPCSDPEADGTSVPGQPPTTDEFFAWSKSRQADLIFLELFVKRTPLSEACRGVVTVAKSLGLSEMLKQAAAKPAVPGEIAEIASGGRLAELRAWFARLDPDEYLERVFRLAGVRYAIMTNIPFSSEEARHWFAAEDGSAPPSFSSRLKPALRVDPLLTGDWRSVAIALEAGREKFELSISGCRAYVRAWVRRIKPIYLMASTPAGFTYAGRKSKPSTPSTAESTPSATQLLEEVLLHVAAEENLPLALKVGALRGANPALRMAGDGVEVADLSFLTKLCSGYPTVKFLVTVLSADNQHELCVLARKFGNLHVYGCWWFCNNPSIIETTTRMRLEMLGSAFTAQHSDARVLDQLIYKWKHSREAISLALAQQYRNLISSGWEISEADISRDLELLFGGAFEAFLAK